MTFWKSKKSKQTQEQSIQDIVPMLEEINKNVQVGDKTPHYIDQQVAAKLLYIASLTDDKKAYNAARANLDPVQQQALDKVVKIKEAIKDSNILGNDLNNYIKYQRKSYIGNKAEIAAKHLNHDEVAFIALDIFINDPKSAELIIEASQLSQIDMSDGKEGKALKDAARKEEVMEELRERMIDNEHEKSASELGDGDGASFDGDENTEDRSDEPEISPEEAMAQRFVQAQVLEAQMSAVDKVRNPVLRQIAQQQAIRNFADAVSDDRSWVDSVSEDEQSESVSASR